MWLTQGHAHEEPPEPGTCETCFLPHVLSTQVFLTESGELTVSLKVGMGGMSTTECLGPKC